MEALWAGQMGKGGAYQPGQTGGGGPRTARRRVRVRLQNTDPFAWRKI